jgi:hypothetical protein
MALSLSDPQVIIGILGGVIVVVVVGIAILYLNKKRQAQATREKTLGQKAGRLAYQPDARPIPTVHSGAIPRPVQKTVPPSQQPRPKDISIINGRTDITESLLALVEKYSLEQFTIATSDGLVFASSGADTAQEDAARYGELFANDPLSETPGVTLFGIGHKGSNLVIIIRTPRQISEEILHMIENDTKDILNWWI